MRQIKKAFFLLMIVSLFSNFAFSAPGGGGGGGGRGGGGPSGSRGGGPGGPGSRGGSIGGRSPSGPGSASNPSFSSKSGPSNQSRPSSSNSQRGSSPDRNLPSFGGALGNSDVLAPNPSNQPAEVAKIPDSAAEMPNSSNERIMPEMMNYRGNRIVSEGAEFLLQNIKSERVNSSEVSLEITFNQSVNPLSFSEDSILIDGIAIPPKTKFSFNKKGDTIRMYVPSKSEKMNVLVQNVESFDGTVISPVLIEVK